MGTRGSSARENAAATSGSVGCSPRLLCHPPGQHPPSFAARGFRALLLPGGGRAPVCRRALRPPNRGRNRHIRNGKPPPESRLIRLFPNMESTVGASGGLARAGGGRGPRLPGPARLRQRCGGAAHGGGQTCTGRGALSPGRAGPPGPAFPGARL